jgi:hypothetical protein
MGNFQNKEGINLANEIDYIAANYILNNKDDFDLTKDSECNHLVQKVSSFLKKRLNGLQANYLLKTRILATEKIDTKCKTIASLATFYVQIANIFAAITASVYASPAQADADADADKKQLEPRNFCSERLKTLINGQTYPTNPKAEMIIQPNVCSKNKANEINNLALEPGIAALHKLYYDIYDVKEGNYTAMSSQMQKIYKNDVNIFYKSFYGEDISIPDNIIFFSDISLNDTRSDNSGCTTNSGIYAVPYKGLLSDKLFSAYALHIKEMEARMELNQNNLLKVLDELFIVKKDVNVLVTNANNALANANAAAAAAAAANADAAADVNAASASAASLAKPTITLHPDLNDRKLQRLSQTTRELIIQLFTTCEKDYKEGLRIYQRIVDNKLQNFIPIKKRILKEEINKLMSSYFV